MNLTNGPARRRNRDAAERTLMAWTRTSLPLISCGSGLDRIVAAIDREGGSHGRRSEVVVVALGFPLTGFLALAVANQRHLAELRRLSRQDYVDAEGPRLAAATASLIALIGVMAMTVLVVGALG